MTPRRRQAVIEKKGGGIAEPVGREQPGVSDPPAGEIGIDVALRVDRCAQDLSTTIPTR